MANDPQDLKLDFANALDPASEEAEPYIPQLEEPPAPEASAGIQLDGILGGDTAAQVSIRATVLDGLLKLMVRDLRFADFMRDLLLLIVGAVKSEAGSILEVDHANQTLFFRAVSGQSSDQITRFVIPMNRGIAGHVAESKQPIAVNQMDTNAHFLKSIEKAVGFETRNLVAAPILVRGHLYGVLELLNRIGEETYSPSDVELVTYLCESAARVIEMRMMLGWALQARTSEGLHSGKDTKESAA